MALNFSLFGRFGLSAGAVAIVASCFLAPELSASSITFAQFTQVNPDAKVVEFVNTVGDSSASLDVVDAPIWFAFDSKFGATAGIPVQYFVPMQARFSLHATTSVPATANGKDLIQQTNSPGYLTIYDGLDLLLRAEWTAAKLKGTEGEAAGSYEVPVITFYSPLFDADKYLGGSRAFAYGLSGIFTDKSGLGVEGAGDNFKSFSASGVGTFSAYAVPEPGTYALLGGGLVLLGALRRRV